MKSGVYYRHVLILLFALWSASANAHDRSESFSEWTWRDDQLHYSFSVLQREVTRIPGSQESGIALGDQLSRYLGSQITVASGGRNCGVDKKPVALRSREGFLHIEGSFRCSGTEAPTITINSFFDLLATHTHYVKVRFQGRVEEFLLTSHRRSQTFTAPGAAGKQSPDGWQVFSQYIEIGAKHILSGADHLAFLFGLILLARGWKEMAWLITGFTLGHSISLAVAVLGFAQPNSVMVEALIGFTIVLVAIEAGGKRSGQLTQLAPWALILCLGMSMPVWWLNLQWKLLLGTLGAGLFALCYLRLVAGAKDPGVLRLLVTSLFGVIHGFGFAGGLLETDFSAADMAFVLLGFNLGVELGQLIVLIAVIVLMLGIRKFASMQWQQRGANATVTVLSGLGTFWFVSRLIG
ncbi:MAG: HupE/UreJ family protein [Proteobacteria bacterium]|nr:HupE/UreJ family protein [Pseudomonadota bacterium]